MVLFHHRKQKTGRSGEALSGLFGEVLRGGEEKLRRLRGVSAARRNPEQSEGSLRNYIDEGLLWPVVAGAAG